MAELDDNTLVELVKKGDTHAEALLCAKYWVFARNLGKRFAYTYSDLGLTEDDFAAVCFSSLVVAMKKYNGKSKEKFRGYWLKVAKNQCINYINENTFLGLDILRPISFDTEGSTDGLSLHETYGANDNEITNSINMKQLYEFIVSPNSPLTENQKVVAYYMIIENYSYEDLRQLTRWSYNKIYLVAKRARDKVSNFIKSGYFSK